jgi:gliding motility-associated-like protein
LEINFELNFIYMNLTKNHILFLILLACNCLYAQQQNNQWRFGTTGAIDFNTVPPSFVTGAVLSTFEGSASVADRITGALLFYTDGVTVWNANNQVMPNGTGLLGGVTLSSTTAAVIVPKPGSSSLFYIVTIDEQFNGNGIRYSVVDMTLNGGLGDIVAGQKNIFLFQTNSEKLEVVPATDCSSYWLITHDNPGDSFFSFKIDNSGIQTTPVISQIGGNHGNGAGHMKVNRQFNKIAIGLLNLGAGSNTQIELFDFNKTTGIISNGIVWNYNFQVALIYGVEFSPNGKVLYVSDLQNLVQYDLAQPTPLAIENSAYLVSNSSIASLQLGIDDKIYVNAGSLNAINSPNILGAACDYQTNVIANQTGGGGYGLPKWVYYADDAPVSTFNEIVFNENCFGANTQFYVNNTSGISNITWNFGDANTGANNTAAGDTAYHTFSQLGSYNVQAILTNACGFDTLFTEVAIANPCKPQLVQCDVFQYTGAVQQWTVPAGVDTIRVKMWGAAGGGGLYLADVGGGVGPFLGDRGGGGGYTQFELAVTPGESFNISVGQGGKAALGGIGGAGGWPGGGDGGSGTLFESPLGVPVSIGGGGGGGGATIIKRLTNNILIAVAGAGGGSAFSRNGGSGGGLEGQFTALTNDFNQYGFGGTQTAGGAPAQNTISTNSVLGTAGAALQGGNGATDLNPDTKGGGGGGSGYYGGGGGSAYGGSGFGVGSAGGGGSGFLLCTNCPNLSGSLLGAIQFDGTPANPNDPLLSNYPGTGKGNMGSNGGNGLVQICWNTDSIACQTINVSLNQVSCGAYTSLAGNTYTQSGIFTEPFLASNGCDSIVTINLTINSIPNVTVSPINTTILLGDSVQLQAFGANIYLWSPSIGLSCTNCPSVIASPLTSTTYQVIGTDSNSGCTNLSKVKIDVEIKLNEIFVPEAFSPNSDGNNDKVFVRGSIKDFTFSVFNRWGEVVFRTQNQSTGWDGSFRGKDLDAGVFVYYLSGVDAAGNTINKKGNITLVK